MSQRKELAALKTLLSETDQILATKRLKILDDVTPDALFSECRRFRYWLLRTWAADLPTIAFIGLNPSVADSEFDDNTVRKCQIFARQWGYGRLLMLNIYAFRATYPKDMRKAADRLDIIGGKRNSLEMLRQYLEDFKVKNSRGVGSRCAYAWR